MTDHSVALVAPVNPERGNSEPLRFYCAGKVSANDWRHQILDADNGWRTLRNIDGSEPWEPIWIEKNKAVYTGPFFTSCDHSCGHQVNSHGCGSPGSQCADGFESWPWRDDDHHDPWAPPKLREDLRKHIRQQCELAIDDSDVVFAWLEDLTAFGTIWELGFASAKSKKLIIGVKSGVDLSELWFSLEGVDVIEASDPVIAFRAARARLDIERERSSLERDALSLIESPIERQLFAALRRWFIYFDAESMGWRHGALKLRPQVTVAGYRLDFAITDKHFSWKVAVECDGHNFHERTKEQAAHDRSRDRELIIDGWTVLRFTGSEIHKDPSRCAEQIMDAIVALCAKEAG